MARRGQSGVAAGAKAPAAQLPGAGADLTQAARRGDYRPEDPFAETRVLDHERVATRERRPAALPAAPVWDGSGMELYEWLIGPESGSDPEKLAESLDWLRRHPGATGAEYVAWLQCPDADCDPVSPGTVRKAGKHVYGDTWEPEVGLATAPGEEIARLREQVATLNAQIARAAASRGNLEARLAYLEEEHKRLTTECEYLRTSRTQQEIYLDRQRKAEQDERDPAAASAAA